MSTADGGPAVTWDDNDTAAGACAPAPTATSESSAAAGGRVLGAATPPGARVVLCDDKGTNDQSWRFG